MTVKELLNQSSSQVLAEHKRRLIRIQRKAENIRKARALRAQLIEQGILKPTVGGVAA